MKKLAMILLTASMTLATSAAFAEGSDAGSNNGSANASSAPGSVEKIAPNNVDNSKINTTSKPANEVHHKKKPHATHQNSKVKDHKKAMCKDGRCPDQVPGTKESKATGS